VVTFYRHYKENIYSEEEEEKIEERGILADNS